MSHLTALVRMGKNAHGLKRSRKRSRNSSSESEDKLTQERKRDKLADMTTPEATMETVSESGISLATVSANIDAIIAGQDKLRSDINSNFVKQSLQLSNMIDIKLAGLRTEINDKMEAMTSDLRDVQARVVALEIQDAAGADFNGLPEIRQRLDTLEMAASGDVGLSRGTTLIVKGLQEAAGETVPDIIGACEHLLAKLQVNTTLTARRLGVAGQGRTPRPVAMTLASVDVVKQVMRAKRNLKDVPAYSRVYIEPDRPQEIRALEANVRRLAREHPTLEVRRGRVVEKTAQQPNVPPR